MSPTRSVGALKLPVGPSNPLEHREPTGTTFPAMALERLAKAQLLANVTVVRETKASTLNHNDVPRTHLADLLKDRVFPSLPERAGAALAAEGPAARDVVPLLLETLRGPDTPARRAAFTALRKIDSEAADKAGLP